VQVLDLGGRSSMRGGGGKFRAGLGVVLEGWKEKKIESKREKKYIRKAQIENVV
jgi:hypothetical protein